MTLSVVNSSRHQSLVLNHAAFIDVIRITLYSWSYFLGLECIRIRDLTGSCFTFHHFFDVGRRLQTQVASTHVSQQRTTQNFEDDKEEKSACICILELSFFVPMAKRSRCFAKEESFLLVRTCWPLSEGHVQFVERSPEIPPMRK